MKKVFLALFLIFFANFSYAKQFNIAVLYWSATIEGQIAMKYGLEEVFKSQSNEKINYNLHTFIAGDGKAGVKNQYKQFASVLKQQEKNKKYDAIIIQPTDNAILAPLLIKANKLKIPVIAYDQYIVDGELSSFITSDNYQAGELNGEYIASLYPNDKELKIILVEYPQVSSTVERVDGFFDTLKKLGQNYKIVKKYQAVEPKAGQEVGRQIVKQFKKPGSADIIFSINDGGGINIAKELFKNKIKHIKQVTVDGDPTSIQMIKKGQIIELDSAQFCGDLGRETAKVTISLLQGEKYPKKVLIPTFPITKSTVKHYNGWKGKMPHKKIFKNWSKTYWKAHIKKYY